MTKYRIVKRAGLNNRNSTWYDVESSWLGLWWDYVDTFNQLALAKECIEQEKQEKPEKEVVYSD